MISGTAELPTALCLYRSWKLTTLPLDLQLAGAGEDSGTIWILLAQKVLTCTSLKGPWELLPVFLSEQCVENTPQGSGWAAGRSKLTVGDLDSDVLHSSLHSPGPTLLCGGGDPVVGAGNGMVVNHQLGNKKSLSVTPEQRQLWLQQLPGDTGWYQTVLA